jgi:hypothetical protein
MATAATTYCYLRISRLTIMATVYHNTWLPEGEQADQHGYSCKNTLLPAYKQADHHGCCPHNTWLPEGEQAD